MCVLIVYEGYLWNITVVLFFLSVLGFFTETVGRKLTGHEVLFAYQGKKDGPRHKLFSVLSS